MEESASLIIICSNLLNDCPRRTFKIEGTSYLQYVVLGPRLKVINLNILPESSRNELKYSLKIAIMFLSIILKFQVPDITILLGIRKKATVFDGPWSASQVPTRKRDFHNFSFLDAIKLKFFSEDVVSIK